MTFAEAMESLRSYNRHLADLARARAATESMSDQNIAVWLRGHLGPSQYRCSFCAKSAEQVKRFLVGPAAYLCDERIESSMR
jgi:hypothetical protein